MRCSEFNVWKRFNSVTVGRPGAWGWTYTLWVGEGQTTLGTWAVHPNREAGGCSVVRMTRGGARWGTLGALDLGISHLGAPLRRQHPQSHRQIKNKK